LLILLLNINKCCVNKIIVNSAANFFEDGISAIYMESDLKLAEAFLANNLKTIEIVLSKDVENQKLNLLAAQAFGAYAFAFVEDVDIHRAENFYNRGLNYAFKALPAKLTFDKKITPGELKKILLKYKKKHVPALFWLGYNWGQIVLKNLDDPRTLVNLSKVELIMQRCLTLDEAYNFAGVDLFYGCYFGGRPKILGGNPQKSKEFFDKSFTITGEKFYFSKYLKARYYAIQIQDKQLFDKLLDEVLDININDFPQVRLMNSIARKKAKLLKLDSEKYFLTN